MKGSLFKKSHENTAKVPTSEMLQKMTVERVKHTGRMKRSTSILLLQQNISSVSYDVIRSVKRDLRSCANMEDSLFAKMMTFKTRNVSIPKISVSFDIIVL